jgi:transcriptional regulator with XRE-family HTH domain
MNFSEKLKELTEGMRRAELSRNAKLPVNAISDYINKGYLPRLDTAKALAKELGVTLDWLADDSRGMPAERSAKPSPSELSDRALMLEVSRRFRIDLMALLDALDQIERENWSDIRKALEHWREGDSMPPEARPFCPIVDALELANLIILRYSPNYFGMANHSILPGNDRPVADFDPARYQERLRALEDQKDFLAVYAKMRRALRGGEGAVKIGPGFRDGSPWAGSQIDTPPARSATAHQGKAPADADQAGRPANLTPTPPPAVGSTAAHQAKAGPGDKPAGKGRSKGHRNKS